MNISTVRPEDIVECDIKGRHFFAVVTGRSQGGLDVDPGKVNSARAITYRHVTARQVIGHYRRSRASRAPKTQEDTNAERD